MSTIPKAPTIWDEQEIKAIEYAQMWAKDCYRAAWELTQGRRTSWQVYCQSFDHELWMALCRIRGVFA